MIFDSGAGPYTLTTSYRVLTLSGAGISNNSGSVQNFVAAVLDGSNRFGLINFSNSATAGNLTQFEVEGGSSSFLWGAQINFYNTSTAGNGSFTVDGSKLSDAYGGTVTFYQTATAGSSTLIANGSAAGGGGGTIFFFGESTGGTATVKVYETGNIDLSGHSAPSVTIGSLEGSGSAYLGGVNLTVGSNNQSTVLSGSLQDGGIYGGTGGSLKKTGSGTLTLAGASSYTGGTTISGGTILANNTSGSALGSGNILVSAGGVLGGNGSIGGLASFDAGAHLAPGDVNSPGTLTFRNGLILADGAVIDLQLGTSSDRIDVTGGSLIGPGGTGAITLNLANAGGFARGVSYTLFNFVSGQTINLAVGDFSLGTLMSGTVAADYSLSLSETALTIIYNGSASAVPEPITSAVLLAGAAMGLTLWRRRRNGGQES